MLKKAAQQLFSGFRSDNVSNVSYPEEITSHSGAVLPVSKGGIVRFTDPKDIFLLPTDGITAVELVRDLGDEFYETARNADDDLVWQLRDLVNSAWGHRDASFCRERRDEVIARDPNPVVLQVDRDIDQFYHFLSDIIPQFGVQGKQAKSFEGVGLMHDKERSPVWHVDAGFVVKGLFPYVGDEASLIDDRVSARHMRALLNAREHDEHAITMKSAERHYEQTNLKIGNPVFIKGDGALQPEFRNSVEGAISNLSVHTGPETTRSKPRFTFALG